MKKKWIVAIAIYLGLIAICLVAIYVVPSVRGMLEKTYIAEYGSIDVKDEVSAFIVRDETVYVASESSDINRLAEADKLVKANTHVVELTPNAEAGSTEVADKGEGVDMDSGTEEKSYGKYTDILKELGDSVKVTDGYNTGAGYISYYVDGAEAKLSTDALDTITYKDYKALTGRRAIEVPKKDCGEGYPIFKVVKNAKWYLVFYISNKKAEKYIPGETVIIDANGTEVEVTVSQVLAGRKYSKVTLSCKSFFDGFFKVRNLDTTVTLRRAEGLVLEDSSIVEDPNGQIGVFVKNKLGEHIFTPVAKKADNGTHCVVYSDLYVDAEGNYVETIGTYDEIISEPSEEDMANLKAAVEKAAAEEAAEKAAAEKAAAEKAAAEKAAAEKAAAEEDAKAEQEAAEGASEENTETEQ